MTQGGSPSPKGPQRSWRGAQAAQAAPARYNWQRDASDTAAAATRPRRVAGWQLIAYGLAAALLLTGFIRTLLFVTPKTPFVVVAPGLAVPYETPLPPDAWIAEDLERFRQLDESDSLSAGTLLVHDTSRDWHSAAQGLEGIRQQLRELAAKIDRNETVVVYLRMHGAVNDAGTPCLILPCGVGVSALETAAWLPVADILDAVESAGFRRDVTRLVVFDCNRFRVNWSIGTLYNTFSTKLREVVEARKSPNLVVYNSTSPGELGWSAPELQGSVFAYFLRQAISGEADDRSNGGDGDLRVSLAELERYVGRRVEDWVLRHRGEHQHPLLLKAGNIRENATVAWALRPSDRKSLTAPAAAATAVIETGELNDLWSQYARLLELGGPTIDPLAWAHLQQALVRLEQSLAAGTAYASSARDARADVLAALRSFDVAAAAGGADCLIGARQHSLEVLRLIPCHSLPLAAAFAGTPPRELQSLSASVDALTSVEGRPSLTDAVLHLESDPEAGRYVEVHFLRLLKQYRIDTRYAEPEVVASAVNLKRWSERAAAPCDERLLSRMQSSADTTDQTRRMLEDALFSGQDFVPASWNSLQQQLEQEVATQQSLAADLQWRDRTLAELPWLAQWLTRISLASRTQSQEQLDGAIADTLRRLIQSVCRDTADEFLDRGAADELRQDYETLRGRIDHEYSRLLAATTADPDNVREALFLLDLPLLPLSDDAGTRRSRPESRSELRALVARWQSQLASAAAPKSPVPESTDDGDRSAEFLARMENGWRYHPAVELFMESEHADQDLDPNADQAVHLVAREAMLRHALATLPEQLRGIRDSIYSSKNDARLAWSRGERLSRALSGLAHLPLEVDATLELRKRDLEQLLLWHGRRSLEDFYGAAGSQQPPFFATAAQDCLSAAKALSVGSQGNQQAVSEFEDLLRVRTQLATPGTTHVTLAARVSDVVIIDEHIPAYTTVSLGSGAQPREPLLPPGLASFYIDEVPATRGKTPTVAVPLQEGIQHAVPIFESLIVQLPERDPVVHSAIMSFRGHEFASPFRLARLGGTVSRATTSAADSAQVLVVGNEQRAPDVMILLDCSASMQQPLAVESGTTRRFDTALRALQPLFNDLAEQGTLRIGVMLFGHRARWDHTKAGSVVRQPKYARPVPSNQMPYDDVETILPIGRFDPTIAGRTFAIVESAAPWGESPLFLALIEAYRQFPAATAGGSQNIIVITDGLNSQFNAPRDKRKFLPEVLQAIDSRQIPIHVIGFGVNSSEATEAEQAYEQLADRSQGSYTPIEEASELVDLLRGLISRETFAVQDGGAFLTSSPVGVPQLLTDVHARRQPLAVTAANAGISLTAEGGEFFRLQLSPDGGRLTVEPYLADRPQFAPLNGNAGFLDGAPSVAVHQPLRAQGTVEFDVSVQERDGQFVPRPTALWITITPILADGQRGAAYQYYDRVFQPDTGVPVIHCVAADWPGDAAQAEVQCLFRFDELEPDLRIPLASLVSGGDFRSEDMPASIAGAMTIERLHGDSSEIRVVEQYSAPPREFPALRIDLVNGAAGVEVVRRFDGRQAICLHQFRANSADAEAFSMAEFHVTRRDRFRAGAWQAAAPIRVDIAAADGLIVPSPP